METSYTIQMASKISGVGIHTIRAWEKRYKALEPHRDSAGHRVYTKSDIEKLMLLSELCLLGYTISKVANLSIEDLKALLSDLGKKPEISSGAEFSLVKEKTQIDLNQSKTVLMFALRAFKLDVINQELGKIKSGVNSREMAMDLILPLSQEIRDLSSRGHITEAQKKAAFKLLHFHAGHLLYKSNEASERSTLNAVVSGLNLEDDTLSVIAGLLCQHYNYNLNYIAGSGSPGVLVETLKFLNPELLVINAASAYDMSDFEKMYSKGFPGEVLIIGKIDLDRDKFPAKKIFTVQSAEGIDQFLSQKRNTLGR